MLNPLNARQQCARLYVTLWKMPGTLQLILLIFEVVKLPLCAARKTLINCREGQSFCIWRTSFSTTDCYKNKYTIQFLWMACISRFAAAILSGETGLALGTIKVKLLYTALIWFLVERWQTCWTLRLRFIKKITKITNQSMGPNNNFLVDSNPIGPYKLVSLVKIGNHHK